MGLQTPPPPLLASELKHKVLKPHCAHFQYLIKITKLILDETRHLAAKLQTRDQLSTEWFTQYETERIEATRQDIYNLFDFWYHDILLLADRIGFVESFQRKANLQRNR